MSHLVIADSVEVAVVIVAEVVFKLEELINGVFLDKLSLII